MFPFVNTIMPHAMWHRNPLPNHNSSTVIRARRSTIPRASAARAVAAYFDLTSKRWWSGASIDVQGRTSNAGDPDVRRALYEAASAMLTRYKGKTALKGWGQKIAKRCHKKAVVAVARKLAVIMHATWRDGMAYADRPHAANTSGGAPTAKEHKLLGVHT